MANTSASPVIDGCVFTSNVSGSGSDSGNGSGSAMLMDAASCPVVSDCSFGSHTTGTRGACVYLGPDCDALISGCSFSGNQTYNQNYPGGAIYCVKSSPSILDSTFTNNAGTLAGAIFCTNDGSSVLHQPLIKGNTFTGNNATAAGGAIACVDGIKPTIAANEFSGNTANDRGGAVDLEVSSDAVFINNLFTSNSLDSIDIVGGGGAVYSKDSQPVFANNTFIGNHAYPGQQVAGYGGAIRARRSLPASSTIKLINCILYNNDAQFGQSFYTESFDAHVIGYCYSYNTGGGSLSTHFVGPALVFDNSVYSDPLLDLNDPEYHLLFGSPCINSGHNRDLNDITYRYVPLDDKEGNVRPVNVTTDIGVYESQ